MSVKRKATSAHEEPAEATKAYAGASTIDAEEIANFERMAEEWWDPSGKFKPLHQLNPARITYIREQICAHFERDDEGAKPLAGLKLIDIGCGGGLVAEPMHRLGADVTGLDASPINVGIARTHAEQGGLTINYIASSAEEHSAQHAGAYDVVLALEIVEHVADVPLFVDECVRLVKPGGVLVMSTINRTVKSLLMAKIGAEYILRWLPIGTHQWKKFLTPAELHGHIRHAGATPTHTTGLVLNPVKWEWRTNDHDLDVNYMVVSKK